MKNSNAFTTRRNNKEERQELYERLREISNANEAAYDQYLDNLEVFLTEHPNCTLDQIAHALSNDEREQNSIRMSVIGLKLGAENLRIYNRRMEKAKKEENFSLATDNAPHATFPQLNSKKITKIRHFFEVDDNGDVISRFDVEKFARVFFLEDA